MDSMEAFLVDVGVDLGGGDVGVAEEFLDDAEVGAIFEEVSGEAVAQEVWVDAAFESCGAGTGFDDLPGALGREVASMGADEDDGRRSFS